MSESNTPVGCATSSNTTIRHTSIATRLDYDALVEAFEHELEFLDPTITEQLVERQAPWAEVESTIGNIARPHGLVIASRVDQGRITSPSGAPKRCRLYLIGNPTVANEIIDVDRRASFYVPFRVCLYEDTDGTSVVSYDRPASFLAALERPELTRFGDLLDGEIDEIAEHLRHA